MSQTYEGTDHLVAKVLAQPGNVELNPRTHEVRTNQNMLGLSPWCASPDAT